WKFLGPRIKDKVPNVNFQIEGFPGDFTAYLQKVTVLAASNQLGDIIYSTTTSGLFDVLYTGKLLRAIDDMVKADKYDLKVFYKPGIDLLTRGGKLYGLPNTCQPGSVVVYYNTKLLQQQGAPTPDPDWTPDQALATAKRLVAPPDGWGYAPDLSAQGILATVQGF